MQRWWDWIVHKVGGSGLMSEVPLYCEYMKDREVTREGMFISHTVFLNSFCKGRFLQKFVGLFFISVIVKDKLTDL